MLKKDVKIFNDLVDKFSALHNANNHKDFEFIHQNPDDGDYFDYSGYDAHIDHHDSLILSLLCLKKFDSKNAFFYPKNEGKKLFGSYEFNNWSHVANAFLERNKLNDEINELSIEIDKFNKLNLKNLSDYLKNTNSDHSEDVELINKIKNLSVKKSNLQKNISKISSFLEVQGSGFQSFVKSHFPLIHDEYSIFHNGFYKSWIYLNDCMFFRKPLSKQHSPQKYIIDLLNSIPEEILNSEFNEFINRIISNDGTNTNELNSSFELLNQILSRYNSKSICTISPEFLTFLNGYDIALMPSYNYKYTTISEYNRFNHFYIQNLISEKNNFRGLIDYAEKIKQQSDLFVGSFYKNFSNDSEQFDKYIDSIYNILNNEGRAVVLVNKDDNSKFSKKVLDLGFKVESIISLLNFSCVILKKTKKIQKTLKIFDGLDFIRESEDGMILFTADLIKSYYGNDKSYKKEILYKEFSSKDNNGALEIDRYFMPEFKGESLINYLTPIKGINDFTETRGRIIKIANLNNDVGNYEFGKNLDIVQIPPSFKKINESCFLLASKGLKLKPTYFEFKDFPIYVSNNILVFKISDKIIPEFLQIQLNDEKTKAQLKYIKSGNIIPFYKKNDILNKIKINVPSIEEQENEIYTLLSRSIELIRRKSFSDKIKEKESTKDIIDSLRHRLGSYIAVIGQANTALKNLTQSVNDYDKSILPRINRIFSSIENMNNLLESHMKPNIYINSIIGCKEVINNIENEFNFFDYVEVETNFKTFNKEYEANGISVNIQPLIQLIGEVLKNAQKHGGILKNDKTKRVIISFLLEENKLQLSIKNNGNPMSPEMTKDLFIKKGSTTFDGSSGMGGNTINKIANDFDNFDWDLINNKNSEYPVEFIFKFELHQLD